MGSTCRMPSRRSRDWLVFATPARDAGVMAACGLALSGLAPACVTEKIMVTHHSNSADGGARVSEKGVLGDGTAASVRIVTLFDPPAPFIATDLDFNPERPGELWVALRK